MAGVFIKKVIKSLKQYNRKTN